MYKYAEWNCNFCNKISKSQSEANEHEEICNKNPRNQPLKLDRKTLTDNQSIDYSWKCSICNIEFYTPEEAEEHEIEGHNFFYAEEYPKEYNRMRFEG